MHTRRLFAALTITAVFSAHALAHDIWLVPADGKNTYRLAYGHIGDLEIPDLGKVMEIEAYDTRGKLADISVKRHNDGNVDITTAAGVTMVYINYDNRFSLQNNEGEWLYNTTKWEFNAPHKASGRYQKFSKTVLAWSPEVSKPLGVDLEIVPLSNPMTMKPGDRLPIQVFWRSQPLAGVEVEIDGDVDTYRTDANGKVSIPLQKTEYQYLMASRRIETKSSPNADVNHFMANLVIHKP
jgi:nickel transport protein